MAISGSSVGWYTGDIRTAPSRVTYGNGQHNTVYILDVNGTRQVIDTMYLPSASRGGPRRTRSDRRIDPLRIVGTRAFSVCDSLTRTDRSGRPARRP